MKKKKLGADYKGLGEFCIYQMSAHVTAASPRLSP